MFPNPPFIFPNFSSLLFRKYVFMEDENLHYYMIILFHKPYVNLQKNVRGEFLNRQLIIILYSFMEFVYYWSMLEGQTVSNKWYRNIAWITRTKSEVFLSNLAPSVRCKQLEMTWDELFAKTFHRVLGDFSQEVLS